MISLFLNSNYIDVSQSILFYIILCILNLTFSQLRILYNPNFYLLISLFFVESLFFLTQSTQIDVIFLNILLCLKFLSNPDFNRLLPSRVKDFIHSIKVVFNLNCLFIQMKILLIFFATFLNFTKYMALSLKINLFSLFI